MIQTLSAHARSAAVFPHHTAEWEKGGFFLKSFICHFIVQVLGPHVAGVILPWGVVAALVLLK